MHFKETLAFSRQTAPAPASPMLTSGSNRDWNALAGAAEYAPVWFFNLFLEYQGIFHPQNRGTLSRAAKFQNPLSFRC